ncbi:CinA family protein [Kitasatospora sp. NPDC101157]|uniref:CinA family protein n=1 Tax=Kitasatospora sp. NPDC101157 TaxID=3364098 RepID=UPI0038145F21
MHDHAPAAPAAPSSSRGNDRAAPESTARSRTGVLARQITAALAAAGHTVAVAESLTAGRLATALADAPGAGQTFLGGITAYDTALKATLLHVDAHLLARRGAVDPDVAAQMAHGARALTGATYALATTGVAGPAPQDGRPVGTVYIAAATPAITVVTAPEPPSCGREAIQDGAVLSALQLLHDLLRPAGAPHGPEHGP